MGFFDFIKGAAQTAEKDVGGFFGGIKNAVANTQVPGAGVNVGEVAQQIPQATGQALSMVNKLPQTPVGQFLIGTPEQQKETGTDTVLGLSQGIPGPGMGRATELGDIKGAANTVKGAVQAPGKIAEAAGGFFNDIKAAGTKLVNSGDIQNVLKGETGSVSLPFQDGEKVSGEQPVVDGYTAAQGKTSKAPAMVNFTSNPAGPDTQYNFGNLKNPFGLLKNLSDNGVAASFDSSGNVVVHDTDNMAKGVINQVVKENYLEPPTAVKGDVHVMEGDKYDGHIKNVQSNTPSPEGAVPNQAPEAGGGVQNPVLPEEPINPGGANQQQVLNQPQGFFDNLNKPTEPVPGEPTPINENAKQAIVNMGKPLPDETKARLTDWINQRETAKPESIVASQPFKQFDKDGIQAFKAIQSGDKEGKYASVRTYFDNKFQQESDAGLGKIAGYEYQHDYLPQSWNNSSEEVAKVFGKTLKSSSPGFTFDKVISDYNEGIKAGLTPKYGTVSELVQAREQLSNQAIADKQVLDDLVKQGQAAPGPVRGWETISGTDYTAPRPLAEAMNNYLGQGSPLLKAGAKGVGFLKQQVMTQGIPKTALSPHGFTTAARDMLSTPLSEGGIIGGIFRALPRAAVTSFAKGRFEQDLPGVLDLYRAGLTGTAEEASIGLPEEGKGAISKILSATGKAFHDPVFRDQLPEAKLRQASVWSDKMQSAGVSKVDADAAAAKYANTVFGGNNLDVLMRNKDFQNAARTFAFAPDMIESLARTFGETSKSLTTKLTDPTYAPYRTIALNATISTAVVMNLINKSLSGHWMFENDGNHKFMIDTGSGANDPVIVQAGIKALGLPVTYSKGERYANILGQALAFVTVPQQVVGGLIGGDTQPLSSAIQSRLSGPLQGLTQIATNTNALGHPISSPDQSKGQNVANAVGALVGGATPPIVQQGYNAAVSALGATPGGLTTGQLQANYRAANPTASTSATSPNGASQVTKARSPKKGSTRVSGGGRRPKGVKTARRSGTHVSVKARSVKMKSVSKGRKRVRV